MKKNDIVFWTDMEGLPEVEPITLSQNFIPEWFHKAPAWHTDQIPKVDLGTVKTCPGILDYFKVGYVVPLWCDLYVRFPRDDEEGLWEWKTPNAAFQFEEHVSWQYKDLLPEEVKEKTVIVLKALCPWYVRTPKGVSLLQLPMSYHYDSRFSVMPGVIPSDKHHFINQQIVIHNKGEIKISRGTPLAMYVPIKREKYNLIVREETPEDRKRIRKANLLIETKFSGRLRKLEKFLDKADGV